MKISNIFSIENQKLYLNETYIMVLAQYVKKGLYKYQYFGKDNQYIIMDNGLYEKQQVSTSLLELIRIAERSGLNISEIVIPDVINDRKATQQLFLDNLDIVKSWSYKYRFMFVAQGKTIRDLKNNIDFINNYYDCNLSVGISKLSPMDRCCEEAIELYKDCKHPIHFLGMKESFEELKNVKQIVRGLDTNQIECLTKERGEVSTFVLRKYKRGSFNIDLENDSSSLDDLCMNLISFRKIWNELK